MARTEHGTIPVDGQRAPGGTLVYLWDGLIEGVVSYTFDEQDYDRAISKVGMQHPDEPQAIRYAARVTWQTNGLISVDYDCIGIDSPNAGSRKTTPVVAFPNSVSTEPIETHPYFRTGISADPTKLPAALAGYGDTNASSSVAKGKTLAGGLGSYITTGARFQMSPPDPSNSNKRTEMGFIGFVGDDAPIDLRGVRAYYNGNTMCVVTYYTDNIPQLKEPCTIQSPSGVDLPPINGVTVWLHLISSAEQIGKANVWKVQEQYMSGTSNRISERIYKKITG